MTYYRLDPDWTKRTAWAADTLAGLETLGVLVPVEPCEHGNIYPHDVSTLHGTTQNGVPLWYVDTCDGAGIGGDGE